MQDSSIFMALDSLSVQLQSSKFMFSLTEISVEFFSQYAEERSALAGKPRNPTPPLNLGSSSHWKLLPRRALVCGFGTEGCALWCQRKWQCAAHFSTLLPFLSPRTTAQKPQFVLALPSSVDFPHFNNCGQTTLGRHTSLTKSVLTSGGTLYQDNCQ